MEAHPEGGLSRWKAGSRENPDTPCTLCLTGRGGSEAVKQSLRESLGATFGSSWKSST